MFGGIALVVLGIATIFVAITVIGKLMKSLMVGRAREILQHAIGRGPLHGIASGTVVTVLVQSSSTTTSFDGSACRFWCTKSSRSVSIYPWCKYRYLYYSSAGCNSGFW